MPSDTRAMPKDMIISQAGQDRSDINSNFELVKISQNKLINMSY